MRRLRTPKLKKADIWTALALIGLMALSVPSLKDDAAQGKGDQVLSRVKAESAQAMHKAMALITRN